MGRPEIGEERDPRKLFLAMRSDGVAAAVARFIAFEVLRAFRVHVRAGFLVAAGRGALIAVVRIIMVIHGAMKIVRTVKPRASSDEDAPDEPFRTVIAVGSASVRRIVEIAVRTNGSRADTYGDLRLSFRSRKREADSSQSSQQEIFGPGHNFLLEN